MSAKLRRQAVAGTALMMALAILALPRGISAAEAPVGLGTAESFAVLAGEGVTNTGPSVVTGDLGTCPNPAVTGFTGPPNGSVVGGTIHQNDAVACQAKLDLSTAYTDAAGRAPTTSYPGAQDLVGLTLSPGVYNSPTELSNAGLLRLDALGDPTAVFIFQAGSTLITAVNSSVELVNGAQACNVFWQVGSSATLGVGSTFVGTVMASAAIAANTNARIEGRLLASTASVTLDSNVITRPVCAVTTTTEAPTSTSTTTGPTTSTTALPTSTTEAPTSTTTGPTTSTTEAPTSTTTGPGTSTTEAPTSTTSAPDSSTTVVANQVPTSTTASGITTTSPSANTTAPGASNTTRAPGTNVSTTAPRITGSTPTTSPSTGSTPTTVVIPNLPRTGSASPWAKLATALVAMALGGQMVFTASRRRQGARHD